MTYTSFEDWVSDVLNIDPATVTHISPEAQKHKMVIVSVDDLINLWNSGVLAGGKKNG